MHWAGPSNGVHGWLAVSLAGIQPTIREWQGPTFHALRRRSNPMPITVPNYNGKTDRLQFGTLIGIPRNPQTAKGLQVTCRLDRRKYPTGRKVTDEEIRRVNLQRCREVANIGANYVFVGRMVLKCRFIVLRLARFLPHLLGVGLTLLGERVHFRAWPEEVKRLVRLLRPKGLHWWTVGRGPDTKRDCRHKEFLCAAVKALQGLIAIADLPLRALLNVSHTGRLLTPAARRHVARMVRAIAPTAGRLDRRFATLLRRRRYDGAQIRAFLAITPAAASRLRTLPQFLEQVEYNGRRLAKLNVPPGAVDEVLREFGGLLDPVLEGRFEPAREQLQLATVLVLNDTFYQVREAESQAFFGLYHAETEAADLADLLRRVVRVLTPAFRASAGRLFLLDQPAAGRLARPLYIERGRPDERLIADPEMRGRYASYWSYPIGTGALLQFGFRVRYPWLPRELELLVAAGKRCHEALERARMESEIRRLQAEARCTEEDERHRIGRELHDEAGQSLLLLRLQLEMIERDAPALLRPRLAETRAIVERTVAELRRLIAALSPTVLDRLGLKSALRQLAGRFRKMHPASLRLRIPSLSEGLPRRTQEVIYRVAQECLQNIAKHSQAAQVNLLLSTADKSIRLSVADNGAGFCAETARNQPMSFGLAGMRERAALLGGTLAVRSAPGVGVRITLQLPLSSAPVTRNGKNSRTLD